MDILVAAGFDNGGQALLGDTHERVRVGGGLHGVDRNTDTPIGSWMEFEDDDE